MSARRRDALLQWRNWSLPTKLAAVVLVPVIFAISLGIGQIRWQVDRAAEFDRVAQVLDAVDRIEPMLLALQRERTRSVEYLVGDAPSAQQLVAASDRAEAELHQVFAGPTEFSPVVGDRYEELRPMLDGLDALRERVAQRQIDPGQVIGQYSAVVTGVMSLDRALTSTVADPRLSSSATALQDVLAMMEEVRIQQAWVLTGLTDGTMRPDALNALLGSRARLLNKISEARATVAARWQERLDATVAGPAIADRNAMLARIIGESSDGEFTGGFSVTRDQWNQRSEDSVALIDDGHDDLAAEVRALAAQFEDEASDAAGWDSVWLLAALLAATAMIVLISRQLLGSLRQLRRSALDAAEHELPDAVIAIRHGGSGTAAVTPVPVTTSEEVGQVARAFDQVNAQALRLASEQAELRRGYSDVFVGVSRRSQSLLERQLRLFEELEQDEQDPDQLGRLFQLDHLATRMRRNNENLMVLSGSDLARRFTRPTELADVLRAAVSEIEQYPRVVVQPPPSILLRGNTASDLVRLVAELLDNAANFSSPETSVTVSGYQAGDGSVVLDVLDEGIGMTYEAIDSANQRLADVDEDDIASSRRMGLFVAGRLAARHGVAIELHGGSDVEGVRATVVIPAEHVMSQNPPAGAAERSIPSMPGLGLFSTPSVPTQQSPEPAFPAFPQVSSPEPTHQGRKNGYDGVESPWREPEPRNDLFAPSVRPDVQDSPTAHLFDAPIDAAPAWPSAQPEPQPEPEPRPEPPRAPAPPASTSEWFQPAMPASEGDFQWPTDQPDEQRTESGLPQREPRDSRSPGDISKQIAEANNGVHFGRLNGAEQPAAEEPASSGLDAWNFAADDARQAAEAAANPQPEEFTNAGLPRRVPKAHLVPGSVGGGSGTGSGGGSGSLFQRDPEQMRGRLADFQSGSSRGRHRATDAE
ncbi:sensor histidine kinase [Saccharopolyspora cebuensis]|uniref:histidine kinase n=1 Tax=Saccharopolyspora cebuensis TaxID=418759 RepID=A0ABV4CK75_9PSEU